MNGHEMPIRQLTREEIKLLADFHQKPGLALTSTSGLQRSVTNSREVILGMLSMCSELLERQHQEREIADAPWLVECGQDMDALRQLMDSGVLTTEQWEVVNCARSALAICVGHIKSGFKGDTAQ